MALIRFKDYLTSTDFNNGKQINEFIGPAIAAIGRAAPALSSSAAKIASSVGTLVRSPKFISTVEKTKGVLDVANTGLDAIEKTKSMMGKKSSQETPSSPTVLGNTDTTSLYKPDAASPEGKRSQFSSSIGNFAAAQKSLSRQSNLNTGR